MRVLAFETSSGAVSAAVTEDGRVLAAGYQDTGLTHSRTLMPLAENLLRTADISPASLDAVAVSAGPGSFTGIRIGVAAAKGLALGLDIPCAAVSTLAALALHASPCGGLLVCAMDARRGQVYNALFNADRVSSGADGTGHGTAESADTGHSIAETADTGQGTAETADTGHGTVADTGQGTADTADTGHGRAEAVPDGSGGTGYGIAYPVRLTEDRAIALADLADELAAMELPITVTGDGAELCRAFLLERGISCRPAPPHLVRQNAIAVALEGERLAAEGKLTHARDLRPFYLRPPYALTLRQRQADAREAGNA